MNMIKVYNGAGEHVDSYRKTAELPKAGGFYYHTAARVRYLNMNNLYVKGQVTYKGVKIK